MGVWVSRVMWMIGHHSSTAMMMSVAAHALTRLEGAVRGSWVDCWPMGRRMGTRQVRGGGGAATAASAASAAGTVAVMRPGMMRTARERGMMRVGCRVARMVGVHTSG